MENIEHVNSKEPVFYPREALKYAFDRAKHEKLKVKGVCIEVGGEKYYQKVYGMQRRYLSGGIGEDELRPLFEKMPIFKRFVEEGAARFNEIKEETLFGSAAQLHRRLQLMMVELSGLVEIAEKIRFKTEKDSSEF